jgi:hypothetical protein
MHDYFFEHQQALDDAHVLQYAVALQLDKDRFVREMTARVYANRVREDFLSGVRSGVNGTPTFFINGVRHDDSYELETLLLRLSGLECRRRLWFVHNACLTVFHHHNASLWGRDFSSLYSDIKALGRVVTKNFRNRDNIVHPHAKIVDGTFLYLL